ncbi:10058_t:CDS:1, partial [Acaulospora morrowiae]
NVGTWSKQNPLYPCILVNRIWCHTAIPLLWKDPFFNHPRADNATLLVDVYISGFSPEEFHALNIRPRNLYSKGLIFNYVKYLRRINITKIHDAVCFWLESKSELSTDVPIFQSLYRHFVSSAQNIEYIEFGPGSDSAINENIFILPSAQFNLCNLENFLCYGEPINNLYSTIAKVSTRIKNLRVSLVDGYPIFSTTLNDLSNLLRSQKKLERITLDNQTSCFCCSQDLSSALDMTNVLISLESQTSTLSYIYLGSIDFHNLFPFRQLAKCENLQELIITRCWNFGSSNYDLMDPTSFARLSAIELIFSEIPDLLAKTFFVQAGKSLRKIRIRQAPYGMFTETLKCFAENNPNITYLSASINPEEIFVLNKFLNTCQKLKHLELWDKNTPEERQFGELRYLMRLVETINVDEFLPQI